MANSFKINIYGKAGKLRRRLSKKTLSFANNSYFVRKSVPGWRMENFAGCLLIKHKLKINKNETCNQLV